jgi:hypothetical protein
LIQDNCENIQHAKSRKINWKLIPQLMFHDHNIDIEVAEAH